MQARIRLNPARGADKGAISPQTLPLPSDSLLSAAHPRHRCSTKTSRRRPFGSATAPSSFVPNTQKQKTGSTQLGVPTRGAISSQTSPLPSVILSYPPLTQDLVAPPKRVVAGLTAALQLGLRPFPYTCKQESGSTQLGVPTRGRFHLKPRQCPRTHFPTRRPPKTPLLHRNESSSDVWQCYRSVFVRA